MHEAEFRRMLKLPDTQLEITPCDLPPNVLPRVGEVLGRILKVRLEEMKERGTTEKCVSVKSRIATVAEEVVELWNRASVPAIHKRRVISMMSRLWDRKRILSKHKQTMSTCPEDKRIDMLALFDISKITQPAELAADREFLEDQRGPRQLKIGEVDVATTELWQRRRKRKAATPARQNLPAAACKCILCCLVSKDRLLTANVRQVFIKPKMGCKCRLLKRTSAQTTVLI